MSAAQNKGIVTKTQDK